MRLTESIIYIGRLTNPETGNYVGKCITKDNQYWYQDIDSNFKRKDTYPINKFDISKISNIVYYL